MLEDFIEVARIMQEAHAEYEEALQTRSSYLKEIMSSSLSPKIKKNVLEYEEDKIEIIAKKHMFKKMRQLSDELPLEMKEEAKRVEKSLERYLKDIEKRWLFYGNPQGSNIGVEIRPEYQRSRLLMKTIQ